MKTDKTKLLQDIEVMKKKLASMEAELNKPEVFKHFPSSYDNKYYYYTASGAIYRSNPYNDDLKVSVYKTRKEANKAYNKAVAVEKIKRRLLELQGDWEPNWKDNDERKVYICYRHNLHMFDSIVIYSSQSFKDIHLIS